jgi:hypothetical protein
MRKRAKTKPTSAKISPPAMPEAGCEYRSVAETARAFG